MNVVTEENDNPTFGFMVARYLPYCELYLCDGHAGKDGIVFNACVSVQKYAKLPFLVVTICN